MYHLIMYKSRNAKFVPGNVYDKKIFKELKNNNLLCLWIHLSKPFDKEFISYNSNTAEDGRRQGSVP